MAIEIVDLPIENGDFPLKKCDFYSGFTHQKLWFSIVV